MFPLLTSPGPDLTRITVSLQSSNRRVRPRLVWRNGTLLASPVVHGVTGHFSSCVWYLRVSPDDTRGCQCPFVLCLHPHYLRIGVWASRSYQEQIAKSRSFGMWHHHRGYISNFLVRQPHLRCAEKVGNPLQTKQGNRPSFRDHEGRRGSDEVVPGNSVFPSSATRMSGNFWGSIKGAKYHFALQDRTWDYS